MNWSYIVLGVMIVILLYVLYLNYFATSQTKLSTQTTLNTTSLPGIAITDAPTSTRYAYGIWLYVNTWNNTNTKPIFSRPGQIAVYLDNSTPTLYCDISQNCIGTNSPTTKMAITQNFPIQKWTYVTVNVDNQFVDMYLDGKLVKSIQMSCTQTTPPDITKQMFLGGTQPNDIFVALFHRWSTPLSPQDVWAQYMKGNGITNTFMSKYGVRMTVSKDAVDQTSVNLL